MRKLTLFLLAVALCALAVPAFAAASSSFLHQSEAQLYGKRAGYQGKAQIHAFHVAFGRCVRRGRSSFVCPNSDWRVRDGIQEQCRQRVVVTKTHRAIHTRWSFWCGEAKPKVPEPSPEPSPPSQKPVYPGYDGPTQS